MCRIVRAGSPRHTLMPRSEPITNAIAAFSRPKDARGAQMEGKGTTLTLIKLWTLNLTVTNFTPRNLTHKRMILR